MEQPCQEPGTPKRALANGKGSVPGSTWWGEQSADDPTAGFALVRALDVIGCVPEKVLLCLGSD